MIIVFGYSKLAAEISFSLNKHKKEFIVIEPNKNELEFAKKDNHTQTIYQLECYDDDELIDIGIKKDKIKTLFCVHNDFNRNLFITLSARNLNKDLQIIAFSNDNQETKKLKLAGASTVINPYETAALNIFRILHSPLAVDILNDILYGKNGLQIQEIRIEKDSILDGKYVKELTTVEESNLVLLGMQDKELHKDFIFSSRGINHKIDYNDVIVVLGKQEDIIKFKEYIKVESEK